MKHTIKITLILIAMFLATQILGLVVVNQYSPKQSKFFNETSGLYENVTLVPELPYGMQPPEIEPVTGFSSILISFVFAILLMIILMRFKISSILRIWFFVVVSLTIALTLNAFISFNYSAYFILVASSVLAFFKVYKRNIIIHNLTELLIYPGIGVVFVSLFVQWGFAGILLILGFLVLISLYDMWAVWHSKVMIKMAKFQMNNLKLFAGFFIPYAGKKEREQIKILKEKYKNKKIPEKEGRKIRVSLAILGGGDVVFPIITSGIFLRIYGLVPALFIIFGATLSLAFLFLLAEKKKFYPAMPFISSGIFLALILWKILSLI